MDRNPLQPFVKMDGEEVFPLRVLLVEDTPDDETLALRAMRKTNLPLLIRVARDGEQAIQLLGLGDVPSDWTPDLIICDLKMPKYRGDEVLQRVRSCARLSEVPFVIFSSSDDQQDAQRCLHLGADAYVTKPVDFAAYISTVRTLIRTQLGSILR